MFRTYGSLALVIGWGEPAGTVDEKREVAASHGSQLEAARQAWAEGDGKRACRLLDALAVLPGEVDPRDTDWFSLRRLYQRDLRTLAGHTASVRSIAFAPDGRTVATASQDKTIKLWEIRTGKLLATLKGHQKSATSVAFSPNGKLLATGSDDNTVNLWNVEDRTLRATLAGHAHHVIAVGFLPDGKTLYSGSWDKTVKLWHVPTPALRATLVGHRDGVTSARCRVTARRWPRGAKTVN